MGFEVNEKGCCVFNQINKDKTQYTICLHLDDVLCTSVKQSLLDEFKIECLIKTKMSRRAKERNTLILVGSIERLWLMKRSRVLLCNLRQTSCLKLVRSLSC